MFLNEKSCFLLYWSKKFLKFKTLGASFDLVKQKFGTIRSNFCINEEHQKEEKLLHDRCSAAITIKGTRSFHSYVSAGEHKIKCKKISNFDDSLSEIFKFM